MRAKNARELSRRRHAAFIIYHAYLPGIALALTMDQSDGNTPQSSPNTFCSYSRNANLRFERRNPPCPFVKFSRTVAFRFERRTMAAFFFLAVFTLFGFMAQAVLVFDFAYRRRF